MLRLYNSKARLKCVSLAHITQAMLECGLMLFVSKYLLYDLCEPHKQVGVSSECGWKLLCLCVMLSIVLKHSRGDCSIGRQTANVT